MKVKEMTCPLWGTLIQNNVSFGDSVVNHAAPYFVRSFYSPRAGGVFRIGSTNPSFGEVEMYLQNLTPSERANLSFWIYWSNWKSGLLRPQVSKKGRREIGLDAFYPDNSFYPRILQIDENFAEKGLLTQPSAEERLLCFMKEVIYQWDQNENTRIADSEDKTWILAASGCRNEKDLNEFWEHAQKLGWLETHDLATMGNRWNRTLKTLDLSGRMWVEGQERVAGEGRQGFVAMWFDPCMDDAYDQGFRPAIEAAGYEPYRVDQDQFLGKVDDRIIAAIRQSRFVVADFTCGPDGGARGGVYFEAGFAQGLNLPVIFTCRRDCFKHVHFDTDHINHVIWEEPEDLRSSLQARIEATIGQGPETRG